MARARFFYIVYISIIYFWVFSTRYKTVAIILKNNFAFKNGEINWHGQRHAGHLVININCLAL